MRRLLTAFLSTLLLLALAAAASAQTTTTGLDAAASALRRDRVYVDPAAERAQQVSLPRLRERVGQGDGSVFVAVLPAAGRLHGFHPLPGRHLDRTAPERRGQVSPGALGLDAQHRHLVSPSFDGRPLAKRSCSAILAGPP